jgi:hypothetical protein
LFFVGQDAGKWFGLAAGDGAGQLFEGAEFVLTLSDEGLGLESVGPSEPPVADGNALDAKALDSSVGLELVDEVAEELVEVLGFFVGIVVVD